MYALKDPDGDRLALEAVRRGGADYQERDFQKLEYAGVSDARV